MQTKHFTILLRGPNTSVPTNVHLVQATLITNQEVAELHAKIIAFEVNRSRMGRESSRPGDSWDSGENPGFAELTS